MSAELSHGFGMALAQKEAAMYQFERLNGTEKLAVLHQVHNVRSKEKIRCLSMNGSGSGASGDACTQPANSIAI